ncbi:hypothetical protein D6C91_05489 [Aureobasidium pullulans]|uniref:DUF7580 domain-containing protein n=1 Tax=Aureobasidium pullulans TaxID=5580 RepID=A0A4S9T477_AURPU|nr:hypothetical protein D6C91_05489 [Aureobasidium pullulans]
MSGLEVAGIVLAVIPLFISAIEHYEDGLGPVKMLRLSVYRRQLAHYRTKLVLEYGLYTNALEELLVDIVPRQDLRNMITQGSGPLWRDPMLDNRLKERLGMIYDTYLLVMRQMQEVMVKIACLLDIAIQDNTAVSQLEHLLITIPSQSIATQGTSQSSVHDLKRRLKFGLKSGQIQPLLEELGRYNSTIYQFTESSKRLEGQRSATPKSTFTTPIHHVRNCAEKLHRCLGGAWTCPLHTSQVIDLQLESRVSRPDMIDDDVEDRVVFSIAFLDDVQPDCWHCLEIHVLTEEIQTTRRATGKVNFINSSPAPSVNLSALPTVHCLCKSVAIPHSHLDRAFCLDHKQQLLEGYPVLRPSVKAQRDRNNSITSLEEVLSASPAPTRQKPFSSKQAYLLGLIVASSFLQLRATPWLCGSWRARNVLLTKDTIADLIDFERPYIRQTYPSCNQQHASPRVTGTIDDTDDNCSFLNLGIMLLEIFFREPLSSRKLPADLSANQSFSDLQTVRRWMRQDKEEMPIGFHKAVSFCIGCFASPNVDLQDTTFRQMVVDQVIVPLKDELKLWSA